MATHTPRDRVYSTLFEHLVANEHRSMPTGAVVPELIEDVDADGRTVRDVLETMAEEGVLVERTERGHLSDVDETCAVYYTADGGPLAEIGTVPPVEDIHEEIDEETIEGIREELGL